jgi:hypothetical protein
VLGDLGSHPLGFGVLLAQLSSFIYLASDVHQEPVMSRQPDESNTRLPGSQYPPPGQPAAAAAATSPSPLRSSFVQRAAASAADKLGRSKSLGLGGRTAGLAQSYAGPSAPATAAMNTNSTMNNSISTTNADRAGPKRIFSISRKDKGKDKEKDGELSSQLLHIAYYVLRLRFKRLLRFCVICILTSSLIRRPQFCARPQVEYQGGR